MAKFCGKLGFSITKETRLGIYEEIVEEKKYYGDIIKDTRMNEKTSNLNDDISISSKVSIISNDYLIQNVSHLKYIIYLGVKWEVKSFDIERPRIIIYLGGLYNG